MARRKKKKSIFSNPQKLVEAITSWVGSLQSLIAHTIFFAVCFTLGLFGIAWNKILLLLTTVVSLEAIYLAILIQMTVNQNTKSLTEVEHDIDEIQEDIAEVEKDIDDIQEDIDEIVEEDAGEEDHDQKMEKSIEHIANSLQKLMDEVERLKGTRGEQQKDKNS